MFRIISKSECSEWRVAPNNKVVKILTVSRRANKVWPLRHLGPTVVHQALTHYYINSNKVILEVSEMSTEFNFLPKSSTICKYDLLFAKPTTQAIRKKKWFYNFLTHIRNKLFIIFVWLPWSCLDAWLT